MPRKGAHVLGRSQLQLLQRSTAGVRCAEVSCSSCLSTAHASVLQHALRTRSAHIAWLFFVCRAQATSTPSMPSLDLMTKKVAGVQPPHLAVRVVMPRCCVWPWCAVCTSVCVHVYIRSSQAANVETVFMMWVMLVTEPGVPGRLRTVPISVACDTYWIYFICEPLLLRPPYDL